MGEKAHAGPYLERQGWLDTSCQARGPSSSPGPFSPDTQRLEGLAWLKVEGGRTEVPRGLAVGLGWGGPLQLGLKGFWDPNSLHAGFMLSWSAVGRFSFRVVGKSRTPPPFQGVSLPARLPLSPLCPLLSSATSPVGSPLSFFFPTHHPRLLSLSPFPGAGCRGRGSGGCGGARGAWARAGDHVHS